MSRRTLNIGIFGIAVMMLLLRPYLVYQMTGAHARQGNPERAWSLLQRLVKKKDDHHEQQADGAAVLAETARSGVRPVIRLLRTIFQSLMIFGRTTLAVPLPGSKFNLPAQQQLYRLTSCFLI